MSGVAFMVRDAGAAHNTDNKTEKVKLIVNEGVK